MDRVDRLLILVNGVLIGWNINEVWNVFYSSHWK